MIGFALSSPPGKPKVAFYNEVAPGKGRIAFGSQQINIAHYAKDLFQSIDPIRVHSRGGGDRQGSRRRRARGADHPVRHRPADPEPGHAGGRQPDRAAVSQIRTTRSSGSSSTRRSRRDSPRWSRRSPSRCSAWPSPIFRRFSTAARQILGENVNLLGLRNSRTILQGSIASLPPKSSAAVALKQVVGFANLAIEGLGFASPVLGSIGTPLTVSQTQLARQDHPNRHLCGRDRGDRLADVRHAAAGGRDARARALGARLPRLVRGLVSPEAGCCRRRSSWRRGARGLTLSWRRRVARSCLWNGRASSCGWSALAFGGLAFGALGCGDRGARARGAAAR